MGEDSQSNLFYVYPSLQALFHHFFIRGLLVFRQVQEEPEGQSSRGFQQITFASVQGHFLIREVNA
ncbi:hypothetical protein CSW47_10820 [Thermus scotoductus]|uniref:Uncharacterized protein n=1 Tax=Thermus scotoductus TaxID=37636 RepID=A0A430R4Z5_THESC|nr:hypothetical protein CSW47_10820 [Thermus scotoductus]